LITGLPAPEPPVVEVVRCHCRARFLVYVGCEDAQALDAEREAAEIGAVFVDARLSPFVVCECGQTLDFALESSLIIQ
jgi:hypothetical protein